MTFYLFKEDGKCKDGDHILPLQLSSLESLLVSFPPLIDMLKFNGCTYAVSGNNSNLYN